MSKQLDHVYWLGGSPCAGKSSIAHRLAEQFSLTLYHCDTEFERQQKLATAVSQPTIHKLLNMPCDELWLRPIAKQLRSEIQFYAEQFEMILADLRQMPSDVPILVEGAALLPSAVFTHLIGIATEEKESLEDLSSFSKTSVRSVAKKAIWVVPTEPFQRRHYAKRPWVKDVLSGCSQPKQAFENWMQRDAAFARWIQQETAVRQLRCLVVDGKQTIAENTEVIANHFSLTLAEN